MVDVDYGQVILIDNQYYMRIEDLPEESKPWMIPFVHLTTGDIECFAPFTEALTVNAKLVID